MGIYQVVTKYTGYDVYTVEAKNEKEAKRKCLNGNYNDIETGEHSGEDTEIIEVNEMGDWD